MEAIIIPRLQLSDRLTVGGASDDEMTEAVLDHDRRQLVMSTLREFGEPVTLPDLAEAIAVTERGRRITAVSEETVKRIYFALYHNHVPKLRNAGLVEYDQETDIVALAEWANNSPNR